MKSQGSNALFGGVKDILNLCFLIESSFRSGSVLQLMTRPFSYLILSYLCQNSGVVDHMRIQAVTCIPLFVHFGPIFADKLFRQESKDDHKLQIISS